MKIKNVKGEESFTFFWAKSNGFLFPIKSIMLTRKKNINIYIALFIDKES